MLGGLPPTTPGYCSRMASSVERIEWQIVVAAS
jgi:hypothetical protein